MRSGCIWLDTASRLCNLSVATEIHKETTVWSKTPAYRVCYSRLTEVYKEGTDEYKLVDAFVAGEMDDLLAKRE